MSQIGLAKTSKFAALAAPGQPIYSAPSVAPASTPVASTPTAPVNNKKEVPSAVTTNAVDIEALILAALDNSSDAFIADTWHFAEVNGIDHQSVVGAVKSLLVDKYVQDESLTNSFWSLTEEGQEIVKKGSPEYQVYISVPEGNEGINMNTLQTQLGDIVKIGLGPCMKNKWLKKQGDFVLRVSDATKVTDETAIMLGNVSTGKIDDKEMQNLKRRKLVQQITRKSYKISRGPDYRPQRVRKMADLTKDMLGTKSEVLKKIVFTIYLKLFNY